MKNIALGAALALTVLSYSAVAAERETMHGKPSIEDQCKAMAHQHGMKGDKVDAWVQKCLEMAAKMKHDRERGDSDEAGEGGGDRDGGMNDSEHGTSGMGGEGE